MDIRVHRRLGTSYEVHAIFVNGAHAGSVTVYDGAFTLSLPEEAPTGGTLLWHAGLGEGVNRFTPEERVKYLPECIKKLVERQMRAELMADLALGD